MTSLITGIILIIMMMTSPSGAATDDGGGGGGDGQQVSVRFTKDNFGSLSEETNQFVELEVERIGEITSAFTVIIQVQR